MTCVDLGSDPHLLTMATIRTRISHLEDVPHLRSVVVQRSLRRRLQPAVHIE
jgi:hypothetical protein